MALDVAQLRAAEKTLSPKARNVVYIVRKGGAFDQACETLGAPLEAVNEAFDALLMAGWRGEPVAGSKP